MKGENKLILNEETVIEAIQFWLESKMVSAPTVTGVSIKDRGFPTEHFSITLNSGAERAERS